MPHPTLTRRNNQIVAVAVSQASNSLSWARLAAFLLATAMLTTLFVSRASGAESENIRIAKALSNAYAEVVEQVGPAVVGIETEKIVKSARSDFEGGIDPFDLFEQFGMPREFGMPRPPRRPRESEPQRQRKTQGIGSGVIIDKEGHILTNNHVIADADSIKVELAGANGKTYKAEIVGRDPSSDVAVIKLIDAPADLPVASLGDSDALTPGNIVIAIGSPMGFKQSVSQGVVSAKGRHLGELVYERFIQTDAAINPGNSGGPLVNLDGEIVGINTMISTMPGIGSRGGSIGIGFAIPSNQAKSIVTQLIEKGSVTRGWIGIVMNPDEPEISVAKGHDGTGVLLTDIDPKGPGVAAGLQKGDLIISFDNIPIKDNEHLRYLVADTEPNREVPIVVLRDGKKVDLTLTVATRPDDLEARYTPDSGKKGLQDEKVDEVSSSLGLTVGNINAAAREKYGISDSVTSGVVVTKVDAEGEASEKGIRPGTIIQEMDNKEVSDVASFRQILKDSADKEKDGDGEKKILLYVRYGEVSRYMMLKLK